MGKNSFTVPRHKNDQFPWNALCLVSSEPLGYCSKLEGLAPGGFTGYRFLSVVTF